MIQQKCKCISWFHLALNQSRVTGMSTVVLGSLLILTLFTQPQAHYALTLPSVSISKSVLRLCLCSLNLAEPAPLHWVCDYFLRETWYRNLSAAALLALWYSRPWHRHMNNTSRSSKKEDSDEWLWWPLTIPDNNTSKKTDLDQTSSTMTNSTEAGWKAEICVLQC